MTLAIIISLAVATIAIIAFIYLNERRIERNGIISLTQENERLKRLVNALDDLCIDATKKSDKALEGYKRVNASYTVTDSDMIKYSTDEEMEERIRKTLLKTIVYDAINGMDFDPEITTNVNGYKVYSFHFHIKQV